VFDDMELKIGFELNNVETLKAELSTDAMSFISVETSVGMIIFSVIDLDQFNNSGEISGTV
jgi:hypothetical protein